MAAPESPTGTLVVDDPAAGRFEARVAGAVAGYAAYERRGSALAVTHTFVGQAFEGRGIGAALTRAALAAARREGLAVLPFCPFVRSYLERHPAELDLVPAGQRARFSLPPADPPPA